MIVVTGVTGKLGSIAADDLLTTLPAGQVAVVARSPEKAVAFSDRGVEVRHGDYDEPDTLRPAFADAEKLLFVSSPDASPDTRPRQHQAVIDAAVAAGVGHVVYTSAITAAEGPGFLADHTVTEAALRDSGLTYTFLRNTFYTDNFVNAGLSAAVEAGELTAPHLGHPLVTATIADLALAASAVLTSEGHDNAVYELRGVPWTYEDLARTLSSVTGKPVAFREVSDDDAGGLAPLLPLLRLPDFGEPTPDLERLLGRVPTSLEDVVRQALGRLINAG